MEHTEENASQHQDYTFATTADFSLGDARIKFTIHPEMICARSPALKAALAKRWNPEHKTVDLADDDPAVFNDYLKCIYQSANEVDKDNGDDHFGALCRAYVLADKYGDLKTANEIIDTIIYRSDTQGVIPASSSVSIVFTQTTENCPLQRLVVDFYIHEGGVGSFDDVNPHEVPAEFLLVIAKEYCKLQGSHRNQTAATLDAIFGLGASERPRCYYHQHDETLPKCRDHDGK